MVPEPVLCQVWVTPAPTAVSKVAPALNLWPLCPFLKLNVSVYKGGCVNHRHTEREREQAEEGGAWKIPLDSGCNLHGWFPP